jgi:vacuolar-type H+-ATPase subunit I/STV1
VVNGNAQQKGYRGIGELSMSAAKPSPVKTEEPTLETRRATVLETERTMREVSERLDASRAKLADWKADRRSLVHQARVCKDMLAQKSMYAVDEQTAVLAKDIADDEDALRDLGERLVSERNAAILAEWEEGRNQLRRQLAAYLRGGSFAKVEAATNELAALLNAAIDEQNQIAKLLVTFEPNLRNVAGALRETHGSRAEIVASKLHNLLPEGLRGAVVSSKREMDAGFYDRRALENAIESLERLELVF